jgi:hypothetical protein
MYNGDMNSGLTLPAYQKAIQARYEASPKTYGLSALSPYLQSNKFAQNALISLNISAKAQELVELLEASQKTAKNNSTQSTALDARSYLTQIEQRGLDAVLQDYLDANISRPGINRALGSLLNKEQ